MKKLVLVLGCLVALVATASPAGAEAHAKRHTCTHRSHGRCDKYGHTCTYWSHGRKHRAKFCDRKPQVVVVHDTTTVVQQQSSTCGACQPSPCENTCQSHEGDDSEHGDHGHDEGHGHEHGGHEEHGKGSCD